MFNIIKNKLLICSAIFMFINLYLIFIWVPTEANQGAIQRILYIHVPVSQISMLAIILVAVSSVLFLWKINEFWDKIAISAAEIGLLYGTIMLLSGILWAKPVWGVWWTGEAKLTTALILYLIYVSYIMFRNYFPTGSQGQRIAAIIAIIGALDTPLIYFAANLWSEAHPPIVLGPASENDSSFSSNDMRIVWLFSSITFMIFFVYLLRIRYKLQDTISKYLTNT